MAELDGVRVILLEDDRDTRDVLAAGLRALGAEVETASSAQVALLTLQLRVPDVLLVDIRLPEVGGCEFLAAVRNLRPHRGWDVPAIAVTAHGTPEDRLATVKAGFRAHLTKPVAAATISTTIRAVLGERTVAP